VHGSRPPELSRSAGVSETSSEILARASAPARWLLDATAGGAALTQTHALSRAMVREAAERWPHWWNAELFGPPHREADLALLSALHDGLRRLRLVRRRGRTLLATVRGRELAADPQALLQLLATDLGGGDPFTEMVATTITDGLAAGGATPERELIRRAVQRAAWEGWRDPAGRPPPESHVLSAFGDVARRGEAYGLIEPRPDPVRRGVLHQLLALTDAGRLILAPDRKGSFAMPMPVLVFDAKLMNVTGVRARLAMRGDQHLTALHDALQEAFGWWDDHLYSFWLDGKFWSDHDVELTSPVTPDEGPRTADVPLAELDLQVGQTIAYVFDFGDEWRVQLKLREQTEPDAGPYPRILERKGTAPPQYEEVEET
jgi:hypothetical protein